MVLVGDFLTRALTDDDCALKFADAPDADFGYVEGYASKFNKIDSYNERMDPKAFDRFLGDMHSGRQKKPILKSQHQQPIGLIDTLEVDAVGLKMTGRILKKTRDGSDAYELAKAGVFRELSVGIIVRRFEMQNVGADPRQKDGVMQLTDVDLREISLVVNGACPGAVIQNVKSEGVPPPPNFDQGVMRLYDALLDLSRASARF